MTLPRCKFGRQHSYAQFVYHDDWYGCSVCGLVDKDEWWSDDGEYLGPDIHEHVDLNQPGWLLAP